MLVYRRVVASAHGHYGENSSLAGQPAAPKTCAAGAPRRGVRGKGWEGPWECGQNGWKAMANSGRIRKNNASYCFIMNTRDPNIKDKENMIVII